MIRIDPLKQFLGHFPLHESQICKLMADIIQLFNGFLKLFVRPVELFVRSIELFIGFLLGRFKLQNLFVGSILGFLEFKNLLRSSFLRFPEFLHPDEKRFKIPFNSVKPRFVLGGFHVRLCKITAG